jgi:hypothetical protein
MVDRKVRVCAPATCVTFDLSATKIDGETIHATCKKDCIRYGASSGSVLECKEPNSPSVSMKASFSSCILLLVEIIVAGTDCERLLQQE